MFQIGLIGFLVSGAFLGLAHFDLFYQFIACTVIMTMLMRREMTAAAVVVPEVVEDHAPEPELAEQLS